MSSGEEALRPTVAAMAGDTMGAATAGVEAGATIEGADCGVHADATGSMIAFERLPRDEHTSLFSYMI